MKLLALLVLLVGCTAKAPTPEKPATSDAGVVVVPDAAKVVDGAVVMHDAAPAPKAVDAAPVKK